MNEPTNLLISYLGSINYKSLSKESINKAKIALFHYLYCMLVGNESHIYKKTKLLNELYNQENLDSPVFFQNDKAEFFESVFLNSLIAQNILHEDIHRASNSHPGIIVFPASIIAANKLDSTGEQFIEAVITGYEAMCKVGLCTQSETFNSRGFRPTSILGVFGSSMAVGKLLNLNNEKLSNAFSIAANFASGLNEWPTGGSDELYLQNGGAARNGTYASFLAYNGINSASNILEAKKGYINAFGMDISLLDNDEFSLDKLSIKEIQYKLAPACALIQTTGPLALRISEELIEPSSITEITLYTHYLGKHYPGCDYQGPFENVLQARMSNQYLFASTFLNKSITNEMFIDYKNNEIYELTKKINISIDKKIDSTFPNKQPIRAEVLLSNGKKLDFSIEDSIYFSESDIIQNFLEHTKEALGKNRAEELYDIINNLEKEANLTKLISLIK